MSSNQPSSEISSSLVMLRVASSAIFYINVNSILTIYVYSTLVQYNCNIARDLLGVFSSYVSRDFLLADLCYFILKMHSTVIIQIS